MHLRRLSAAPFLLVLILLAGILAGCGGGDQSGNESQGGGSQQQQDGGSGAQNKKDAPQAKIALGTVGAVNEKAERFTLRPSVEAQGKDPVLFKLTPEARVTLDGKEAGLADMQKGRQAQVEYVVKKDLNRARSVTLFSEGGGDSGDGG
jgi:hypothetical protein